MIHVAMPGSMERPTFVVLVSVLFALSGCTRSTLDIRAEDAASAPTSPLPTATPPATRFLFIRMQDGGVDESIVLSSKEGAVFVAEVAVDVHLLPGAEQAFRKRFGSLPLASAEPYVRNVTREAFNEIGSRMGAVEIAEHEAQLLDAARDMTRAQLSSDGVVLEGFRLLHLEIPPVITKALTSASAHPADAEP
jgi:hypothetical protein